VGVFDDAASEFVYVNAGHNSPIVIRANGETELLETGGLILGCLPGMAYNEGVVKMNCGDLIFMFTDGVSEAMNDEDEEFGEDRIRDFIIAHRTLPPAEILSQLEAAVNHFCGREPNEDDSTVLIARKT
jgi:sigma-B regulation protein RsbU (phosphoserine phosphatase)